MSAEPVKIEYMLDVHVVTITQDERGNVIDVTIIGGDDESVIMNHDQWKKINKLVEASATFIYENL